MRVLHVHSGNLYGGIERMLGTIARHQHEVPGVEHEFALFFEGRLAEELRAASAAVHRLPKARLRNPVQVLLARYRFRNLLISRQPQVAVFHSPWSWVAVGNATRPVRTALWVHNPIGEGLVDGFALRKPPRLIVANSLYTARATRFRSSPSATRVILYPLELPDAQDRREARRVLNLPATAFLFLHASRMESWKGHPKLLRALAELPREKDWRAIFVGGVQRPSEETYLRGLLALTSELALKDRVIFAGQRDDVHLWMAAADVFCQFNEAPEPFGIVFAEALAAGLPVVTVASGGAPEVLGPYGIFIDQSAHPTECAAVLSKLLNSGPAPQSVTRSRREYISELVRPEARLAELHDFLGFRP